MLIDDIIAKARNREGVFRATYPAAWRILDKKDNIEFEEPGGNGGGQQYGTGTSYGRGNWQRDQHKQGNDGQGGGGIGIGSGGGGSEAALVDHVQPKIAATAMMKPVWEVHGKKIGISALCNGAGIMNRELIPTSRT